MSMQIRPRGAVIGVSAMGGGSAATFTGRGRQFQLPDQHIARVGGYLWRPRTGAIQGEVGAVRRMTSVAIGNIQNNTKDLNTLYCVDDANL